MTATQWAKANAKAVQMAWRFLVIANRKARSGELPVWRQVGEVLLLKARRGQTARFYLFGRFWRRSVPWSDKLDHFNYTEYQQLLDQLNSVEDRARWANKAWQGAQLRACGIPMPRRIGVYVSRSQPNSPPDTIGTAEALAKRLSGETGRRVVFKLVNGFGGNGFLSFHVRGHADAGSQTLAFEHPITGETIGLVQLTALLDTAPEGWVIESWLEQHPVLANLNSTSVNTLRIWVRRDNGGCRALFAFLKVGRSGYMFDNTLAVDGLLCTIDQDTGDLQELSAGDLERQSMVRHPDTDASVAGVKVPFFREALALAEKTLTCMPGVGLAGVDMAITANGPCVIEANCGNPAQLGPGVVDMPGKRLFPDFFGRGNQRG